jgi:hypothetical protein
LCSIPTATPGINQQSLLERLTPTPQKKPQTKKEKHLNNKPGTENEHTAEGAG